MIQIGEMIIRVPGLGENEARELGETVASNLASQLPDETDRDQLNELNVGITLPASMSNFMLADHITKQILQQLNAK